jgi:hypothetical protein
MNNKMMIKINDGESYICLYIENINANEEEIKNYTNNISPFLRIFLEESICGIAASKVMNENLLKIGFGNHIIRKFQSEMMRINDE